MKDGSVLSSGHFMTPSRAWGSSSNSFRKSSEARLASIHPGRLLRSARLMSHGLARFAAGIFVGGKAGLNDHGQGSRDPGTPPFMGPISRELLTCSGLRLEQSVPS